jgi:hypothetical protein
MHSQVLSNISLPLELNQVKREEKIDHYNYNVRTWKRYIVPKIVVAMISDLHDLHVALCQKILQVYGTFHMTQ